MPRSSMPGAPMLCSARQRPSTSSFFHHWLCVGDAIVQPLARFGCGLAGGAADGRIIGQIGEKELEDRPTPIGQFTVGGRHGTEIIGDPTRGHDAAQLVDEFELAPRSRATICCADFVHECGDCSDVLPPDHAAHVGHVAFVVGRVLHAEEKIVPARNHPHLWTIGHLENVVAREHLLDVVEARDQGDVLDEEDWLHAAQHGEKGLRVLSHVAFRWSRKAMASPCASARTWSTAACPEASA